MKTSKSPRKVAQAAYQVALATLPDYAHRFSPRKFSQPQLFVCLVLKIFFKTDYRGIVEILQDSPDLCKLFHLTTIPHYTTLQKASKRLLMLQRVNQLLETTVTTFHKNKRIELAAVDSTGLEAGHISRYFVQRKRSKQIKTYRNMYYRRFPKLAIVTNCFNHMVLSLFTSRGPSADASQFCDIVKSTAEQVTIETLLADAGYDSEGNHQYAREVHHIQTIIPATVGCPSTKLPASKYRRMMRTDFNKTLYGQRWQVETVFSMIKRNQGEALRAKGYWAQNREMMLKVLTHNIGIIRFVNELFYRAVRLGFGLQLSGLHL